MAFFEPKFYEARALWYYAQSHRVSVQANCRLRWLDTPYSRRPEIDGIVLEGRRTRAIEVKSFPLDEAAVGELVRRYAELGFGRLTIIAPAFAVDHWRSNVDVELLRFVPALDVLRSHYQRAWAGAAPRIERWLGGGGIHFRYSVAEVSRRATRLRRTLNQVDKNIDCAAALSRDLRRRIIPSYTPIRVHWSPCRLLFPKDLYYRSATSYVLSRPLVFDIDGPLIHGGMFPCTIDPTTGLCHDCLHLSKQHALRLAGHLREKGYEPQVFFSGHTGFHVYAFEADASPEECRRAIRELIGLRIGIDRQLSRAPIPIIAFPTSIHGMSLRPLVPVTDVEGFHHEQAAPIGSP